MKMYLKIITPAFLVTGILFSCKKDSTPAKLACRIITISETASGDQNNFNYNSEGKLSSITAGTRTTALNYSGNTVIATSTQAGISYSQKKIITLLPNGLPSNIRIETTNYTGTTTWGNSAYDYSGSELIKTTQTSSVGAAPVITTNTWSGGNLISSVSGPTTVTFTYYTDKASQGDYLFLSELLQGYSIIKNKNAVKSLLSGSDIANFAYAYDADGKITSCTVSGAAAQSFVYQYQCN